MERPEQESVPSHCDFFLCLVSSPLARLAIMRFYATVTPVSCGCEMEKLIMASVQCFDQLK